MNKIIYLDHAATTYIKNEVADYMRPYLSDKFGNASSIYLLGRDSRTAIDKARQQVARALNCKEIRKRKQIMLLASYPKK